MLSSRVIAVEVIRGCHRDWSPEFDTTPDRKNANPIVDPQTLILSDPAPVPLYLSPMPSHSHHLNGELRATIPFFLLKSCSFARSCVRHPLVSSRTRGEFVCLSVRLSVCPSILPPSLTREKREGGEENRPVIPLTLQLCVSLFTFIQPRLE